MFFQFALRVMLRMPQLYFGIVVEGREQLGDCLVERGMNELGSKLGQGYEHKPALMQSRMRQRQESSFAGGVAIKKKIQVDYARALCQVARSSQRVLHLQQPRHDFLGSRKRVAAQLGNHIEKQRLRESFHWFSFKDLLDTTYLESCLKHAADAEQQIAGAVTKI